MFKKEEKQKSTKIKLGAGAYLEAVLPTVRGLIDLNGRSFHFNGNKRCLSLRQDMRRIINTLIVR